jgi:outer membrane protein assembly factor BamB
LNRSLFSSITSVACVLIFAVVGSTDAQELTTWPGFRGERGDGHVAQFPQTPFQPKLLWRAALPTQGVGGVAANSDFVIASSRSEDDKGDVFVCFDPTTGVELWRLSYEAIGQLDYGNSPRATPLIHDPYVFLLGAFGDLKCVDIDSGEVKWSKHLIQDLGGLLPGWGYGWSPTLVDGNLIVMPGGKQCSIAALSIEDGSTVWQTPGEPAAYATPQVANWTKQTSIIAYDTKSLGGWDAKSGERLWRIQPKEPNDFNVPTPVVLQNAVVVASENNGTRRYDVNAKGTLEAEPIAQVKNVAPDAHTPVALGSQLIVAERELISLDLDKQLAVRWRIKDRALRAHNSVFAGGDQILVVTQGGELLLIKITETNGEIVARHKLGGDTGYLLSHPALSGNTLYVRGENSLQAWSLWE